MKNAIVICLLALFSSPLWAICPPGVYCNPYAPDSPTNPYAVNPPRLYDEDGNYRGRLSVNPYLPDSTSNPYGRYGSRYSPDSLNNPYGAGNPYINRRIYLAPSDD